MSVGEQLPWPSAGEQGGGGGLDDAFEDSLGDFDEAMTGGTAGGGAAGEGDIEILDPMGSGGAGAPTDQPLFEESDVSGDGDSAENESVAQRAESGSSGGSSSSSAGGGGGAQGGESGEQQSGEQQTGGQQTQSASSAGGGGQSSEQGDRVAVGSASTSGEQEGEGEIIPIPADVGDGRNDDIVLRQIREAAMNEKDPVLREKLWDEYRRIRGSR